MDDATKRAYIRTRLSKARQDLAAARSLLTLGDLRVAIQVGAAVNCIGL